jgi:hypothetical protein
MGEGPRLTTSADPLVQRQSIGGTASDGEPRATDPGVDRVTWRTPEQKATAIGTLRPRGDRPQPWRRV